jgi:hypothetical protein
MKADESAYCAGRWKGRLSIELCFSFFLGLEIVKFNSINSDFGWV